MKCVVTGGGGFIGSHLVERLLADGHKISVIDKKSFSESSVRHINPSAFKYNQADIFRDNDDYFFPDLFENIDWVFHLAGLADIVPSVQNPQDYFDTNVTGTLNVLEAARAAGVKRFIYAASSSCYGIPTKFPTSETAEIKAEYPYALTKRLGEELVLHWGQVYKLPVVSLRLFNVYGPRSRTTGAYGAVFGVFLKQKLLGKPFTVVGDGTQRRDFVWVGDVANAFVMAAESKVRNEVFNVGAGHPRGINELVSLLGGYIVNIPKRPGEPDITWADISKINGFLGWRPKVGFEEGVGTMLSHIEDWKEAPLWEPETIAKATEAWHQHLGK